MFQILAGLLAFYYGIIPNYAVAIALLTLTVMLLVSPLTLKSTRSMLAMQKLQPELKRLQAEHKGDRQKLNEAMMALYKEHSVNPVAGCLPMILQAPVFIIIYQVVRGLTSRGAEGNFMPKYLNTDTELYRDLVSAGGQMKAFGIDLARSATEGHSSFGAALPFFIIVALVIFLQYYQTRQTMARNKNGQANPQQQILMKVLPAVFGIISLSIQAALNIYFLVSALFRIGQTAAMYRFDPKLKAHVQSHRADVAAAASGRDEVAPLGKPAPKPSAPKPSAPKPPNRTTGGRANGGPKSQGRPNSGRAQPKRKSKKGR